MLELMLELMSQQASSSCPPITTEGSTAVASDAELMAAIVARDQSAFSDLYDRYAATLYGICLRVLRNSTDAETVVSDVFWEIWRKSNSFDPQRGSCRAYLFTLTRCRAIDRLRASATRAKKSQEAIQQSAAEAVQEQDNLEPSKTVLADERRQAVRAAIAELDASQREALQMSYFGGLTHREISDQLDLPLGTVKTHIRRGLLSLKAMLKTIGE